MRFELGVDQVLVGGWGPSGRARGTVATNLERESASESLTVAVAGAKRGVRRSERWWCERTGAPLVPRQPGGSG